jgi:hypothetical protein
MCDNQALGRMTCWVSVSALCYTCVHCCVWNPFLQSTLVKDFWRCMKLALLGIRLLLTRAPDGTDNGVLRGKSDSTSISQTRNARAWSLQCETRWTLRFRFCVLLCLWTRRVLFFSWWQFRLWSTNTLVARDFRLPPRYKWQLRTSFIYRRFGTTCISHLQRSRSTWPLRMGPIGCSETLVNNHHSYVLTPWLFGPLRALAPLNTKSHSSVSTAFCRHPSTFNSRSSFST